MAYTVLARKYRSQTFDEVIGQKPISQTLKNAIKTGRVAHAYLFCGTRGVGKTTMARIMAKALNCLSVDEPTMTPCCKCESCTAVNSGEDIDVIEIDGATNNGVEEVRRLRENAIYRPARARFKIYIIDEVHMLSTGAFNALLKILEEPPAHVKFIFATTEPNKIIPTIQSRCQRFDFNNISPAAIAQQLKDILGKEKIKYEDDLVYPLAKMANGSMRDALSLLDRLISTGSQPLTVGLLEEFLGCPNSEKVYNLIEKIGDNDAEGTLTATEELINAGLNEVQIADSLVECMRDLMVVKSTQQDSELLILTEQQRKRTSELAEKFDVAAIVYNITTLERLRWIIKNSETARALLEASLLRMALSEHFMNVDALLGQMNTVQKVGIKKNATVNLRQPENIPPVQNESVEPVQADLKELDDVGDVKENWKKVLEVVAGKAGSSNKGILSNAIPAKFEDGVLTLVFADEMLKKMCASNGRLTKIEQALGEVLGKSIKLKLKTGKPADKQKDIGGEKEKTSSQKRNEIINDPAVRTLLTELNATIANIEENQ